MSPSSDNGSNVLLIIHLNAEKQRIPLWCLQCTTYHRPDVVLPRKYHITYSVGLVIGVVLTCQQPVSKSAATQHLIKQLSTKMTRSWSPGSPTCLVSPFPASSHSWCLACPQTKQSPLPWCHGHTLHSCADVRSGANAFYLLLGMQVTGHGNWGTVCVTIEAERIAEDTELKGHKT